MASSNSFYTSSPTVVLPPSQPTQLFSNAPFPSSNNTNGMNPEPITPDSLSETDGMAISDSFGPSPGALAGRKRSRGDIFTTDEVDESDGARGRRSPGKAYLSSPSKALHPSAITADDLDDVDVSRMAVDPPAATKPPIISRKSQRLDSSASSGDYLAQLVLPPQMREATIEPLIDEATRTLGISWVRMDSSEALKISQAAYAKWIQNHYPGLKDVSVWFENSAIPGYLIEASNAYRGQREYYIFSNDLVEARLVTSEPEQLVPRLKMLPALHLAAPGGCLRANLDLSRTAVGGKSFEGENGDDTVDHPAGICAAHSMETD